MINLLRITTVQESLETLLKGQLRYFKEQGYNVSMASSVTNPDRIIELETRESCTHYELPLTRKITPIKDIIAIWRTYKLIKRINPHIVHTHTPKAGLVGMFAAWLARVPVRLHTVAGLPLMEKEGLVKKILIYVERLTYYFATQIYPNSFGLRDFIFEEISKNKKIKVIGKGSSNGINIDYYSKSSDVILQSQVIRTQLGLKEDEFIWIFVGRVVRDKGINELVDAFQIFQQQHPNNSLLIVGPFEDELDPVSQKTKLLLENHSKILCIGFQKDVRPYLCVADALIFPSYREGFPNVPMQAACMGLPLILTDINGCNELIEDKISGLLIKPKSVEAILEGMKLIFSDEDLRRMLALNIQNKIRDNFSQDVVWNYILNEYNKMLLLKKIQSK